MSLFFCLKRAKLPSRWIGRTSLSTLSKRGDTYLSSCDVGWRGERRGEGGNEKKKASLPTTFGMLLSLSFLSLGKRRVSEKPRDASLKET